MPVAAPDKVIRLDELDQSKCQTPEKYRQKMKDGHLRLLQLQHALKDAKRSVIVVVEGPDASGKGGAIKRLVERLDPRHIRVYSTIKPTDEEYSYHYLWRFWNKLPRRGEIAIFDRSWYGRVLVERVEGFCSEADWMRAYAEINDFEQQLAQHGLLVVKFWLAISKEEQFRRFKEREKVAFKRFKITDEDWRNRKKWDAYERAVCDMIDGTSTNIAPWTLVEANNKYYARIKVLGTLADAVEAALARVEAPPRKGGKRKKAK